MTGIKMTIATRKRIKKKDLDMGRVTVDVEISNYRDLVLTENGFLEPAKVRRLMVSSAVVDTGAMLIVLPQSLAKELGLPVKPSKTKVTYANGKSSLRNEVSNVHVRIQGRDSVFDASVEPHRKTVLLGAVVLETLDLLVDCGKQSLVPRDPDHILTELF